MATNKLVLAGSEVQPIGTRIGDQPVDEKIEVSIILKPKERAPVPRAGSASVSREQFAAKYGADEKAIEQVKQFAQENNLTVTAVSPERRTVQLEGTAADMIRAFDTQLERYHHQGIEYRARTAAIKLPPELVTSVEAVLGLDNRTQARAHFRVRGATSLAASAAAVSYTPRQVAEFYQFPTDVDGTGETVGILELGGGYKPADLKTYFSSLGVKEPTVVSVSVDKAKNKPTNANSADGEVLLDIEVVGAVAPGAKVVGLFRAQHVPRISGRADHRDSRFRQPSVRHFDQLGKCRIHLDGTSHDRVRFRRPRCRRAGRNHLCRLR